jgi:hypothetical protein
MAENDERMFHFQLVPHRNVLITLEDKCKGTNELLDKWGLRGNLKCHTFFYNGHFQSYQKIAFVKVKLIMTFDDIKIIIGFL